MWNYFFLSVGGYDLFSWRLRGCKSWEGKSWWWRNMKIQPLTYQLQAPFAARNELTDSACNPPTYFSPYTMIQDRNQIFGEQRRYRENMRINCDMPLLLRSSMYVISHCDFFTAVYCWLGFSDFYIVKCDHNSDQICETRYLQHPLMLCYLLLATCLFVLKRKNLALALQVGLTHKHLFQKLNLR